MYKFSSYIFFLYFPIYIYILCHSCICCAFDAKNNFFIDLAESKHDITDVENDFSVSISNNEQVFHFDSKSEVGVAAFRYNDKFWFIFSNDQVKGGKNALINFINNNSNKADPLSEIDNCIDMSAEGYLILSCNNPNVMVNRSSENIFKINIPLYFGVDSQILDDHNLINNNKDSSDIIDIKWAYKNEDLLLSGVKLTDPLKIKSVLDLEDLYIFPSYNAQFKFHGDHQFLHGDFFDSYLGVVFRPSVKDLEMYFNENETRFHSDKLSLSSSTIVTYELPKKLFDPQNWFFGFKDDFLETQSILNNRIISYHSDPIISNGKVKARMTMVLFLIANKMPEKAELYLDIMKLEQVTLYHDNFFNFISGVVLSLNNKFLDAQHAFDRIDRSVLSDSQSREIALWENFIDMRLSNDFNAKVLVGDIDIIQGYGEYAKFMLLPLFQYFVDKESYIDALDVEKALRNIKDTMNRREKNTVLIEYAKLLSSKGDNLLSLQILSDLQNEKEDRYAIAYAKMMELYIDNEGEKKLKTAINSSVALRKMQFLWRGKDGLEASILEFISNTFFEMGEYVYSLDYAKQILDYMPGYRNIMRIMHMVEDVLYVAAYDERLTDIDRVDIFIEFSRMIPTHQKSIEYLHTYIKSLLNLQMHYYVENVIKNILSFSIKDYYKYIFSKYLMQSYFETFRYEDLLVLFEKYSNIYRSNINMNINNDTNIMYMVSFSYSELGKYQEALSITKNFINNDSRFLELYYDLLSRIDSWKEVELELEDTFVFREDIRKPLSIPEQKLIVKLAYTYFSEKKIDLFKKLYYGYNAFITDETLKKELLALFSITKNYFNQNDYIKDLDYLLS